MIGALCAAVGALAAAVPDALAAHTGVARLDALRAMFAAYGVATHSATAARPSTRPMMMSGTVLG